MKKILIIEDEKRIRAIYMKIFQALGVPAEDIFQAENAIEATGILLDEKIQLVLLDINLPTIDGTIMYDVIKDYAPTVDIIIASVHSIDKQKQMFPKANDYYDKSQGPFVLLDKLAPMI